MNKRLFLATLFALWIIIVSPLGSPSENPPIYHKNDHVKVVEDGNLVVYGYHEKKVRLGKLLLRDPITSTYSGDINPSRISLWESHPGRNYEKVKYIERDLNTGETILGVTYQRSSYFTFSHTST
jgi:hypothetical protein